MTSETETGTSRTEDPLILALLITVAQEVCTAMCASEVVISGLDAQGFRGLAGTGEAPGASAGLQHDSRFSADRLKAGEVVFLKDADGNSGTPPPTAGSLPVSAMAVPILTKDSVVGALEIFFATHTAICAADIAPMEKIADFLGPILARSGYGQPMTGGSTLGGIRTQTSLPAEIQTRGQPSGTPNSTVERVDPLSLAAAPRPRASLPASRIASTAAEKSWQAVPTPNVAAVQKQATSPTAQGSETGSPPAFTLGHARASENTTEPDQASTRNTKGILIGAVAAVLLVLAAGSALYLRRSSSPARSKGTAAVSQPPASAVVSQSVSQDGTAKRATFPGEVTLASPPVTTRGHPNTQSAATSTTPICVSAVLPGYPLLAKSQHVEGDVQVDAVIDVNGRVTAAKAVSGPPLLQQAAVDALRQWKYRPATRNGKPVAMHLSVTIRFRARE
jgi:TonB family protein